MRLKLCKAIDITFRRSDVIVFIPENMRWIGAINDKYAERNTGNNQVTHRATYASWKACCELFNATPPARVYSDDGVGMRRWSGSEVVIGLSCFGFLGHNQITYAL